MKNILFCLRLVSSHQHGALNHMNGPNIECKNIQSHDPMKSQIILLFISKKRLCPTRNQPFLGIRRAHNDMLPSSPKSAPYRPAYHRPPKVRLKSGTSTGKILQQTKSFDVGRF
eukprot:TRINITY_DN18_c0_g1_i10.p1 TRINITY_DN18_c0_g1~~TRINITY_DN18_c0_g1_i10.p1  ORF type:complete len:114 (+),score=15.10 TRINITY_DN18_c0_g1_i10:1102-1443(+)